MKKLMGDIKKEVELSEEKISDTDVESAAKRWTAGTRAFHLFKDKKELKK